MVTYPNASATHRNPIITIIAASPLTPKNVPDAGNVTFASETKL